MVGVVLFSGRAESGKDSAACILKEMLEKQGKRVLIMHFADLLKYYCKQYFGWNGEKDDAGRSLLQRIGTDVVRAKDKNFWVDAVINFIKVFSNDYDYFLIPDCRFPGEAYCFAENDIKHMCVRVIRKDYTNKLTEEQKNHPSERAMDGFLFDCAIESESGLDNLKKHVESFYNYYIGKFW